MRKLHAGRQEPQKATYFTADNKKTSLWNIQLPELSGADRLYDVCDLGGGLLNPVKVVGRELKDGDTSAGEVLLIANVLVRGYEKIELLLGKLQ
jgi:hypothetical protein